jgi:hypothetical protein
VAIKIDDLDLPSGEFLSPDEKERICVNGEPFFLRGGEPKAPGFEGKEQTIFQVVLRDPGTGEEQERLLAFGHTRKREALCVAAVQADDDIGPCYLHKGTAEPGKNPPWIISGEKPAKTSAKPGGKGKGSVPWEDGE